MVAGDGYSDFFVEGSGPPWHEAFSDVVTGKAAVKPSAERMAYVQEQRRGVRAADGGYSDFFVEGSGPPWHEAFTDVVTRMDPAENVQSRVHQLRSLNVTQAFERLRMSATRKR
jgi:hypothetical protein